MSPSASGKERPAAGVAVFLRGALLCLGCAGLGLAGLSGAAHQRVAALAAAGRPQKAAQAVDLAGPEPGPVEVPAELLARTSMPELSGVAWSERLARYLVISDDTGDRAQGTSHAPWLFTMSRAGALDRAPLVIAGLERLNDAEAICAGPDGTFFLATSHSLDKKGRAKGERRRLLQLRLLPEPERALHVTGALDLSALMEDPQVAPAGRVDIEAMAFRDGALYLGLKAPLTAAGAAQIVRVRGVAAALRQGAVAPDAIERFAEVPLQVPALPGGPGAPMVAQGISDMGFLPDGSLVLLANSPKHLPPDGGGALWWLRTATGAPRLLRRFPGLKPEGVTLSPDGKALVIVFDRDRQPPQWLLQPLPR